MAQKRIHDTASTRVMAYRRRRLEGMKRVEIWLSDTELEQLDAVATATGASRARVVAHLLEERMRTRETTPNPAIPIDADAGQLAIVTEPPRLPPPETPPEPVSALVPRRHALPAPGGATTRHANERSWSVFLAALNAPGEPADHP